MKTLFILLAAMLLAAPVLADHHEGAPAEMPPMGRPAELDALNFMLGEWTVEMKFKMDPAGEWQTTSGTAVSASVLNGCAHRMDFESTFLGMPFHGVDHTTFNRETGQYESVWLDDMGAKLTTMSGNFVDGALVMTGTDIYQGMKYHTKSTSKKISDDEVHWVMLMSLDEGETWMDSMEMVYKRKK